MELSGFSDVNDIREQAKKMAEQFKGLEKLIKMEIPGRFVFAPPHSSRLCVETLSDLHEARKILRDKFGWEDQLNNKFYSCGNIIATYQPDASVDLPFFFSLWVDAPADRFPSELLGNCKVEKVSRETYDIICPI